LLEITVEDVRAALEQLPAGRADTHVAVPAQ
jgi:hypothetical protein